MGVSLANHLLRAKTRAKKPFAAMGKQLYY